MRLTSIALFIHILGVISIFSGFYVQQSAGSRLRSSTWEQHARHWADLLMMSRHMIPTGAGIVLASGAYLSTSMGRRPAAWIPIAAGAALFIAISVLVIVNRGIVRISETLSGENRALPIAARRKISQPSTWAALTSANGVALGTLWLMTAKPNLVESVTVTVVVGAVGAVVGARLGNHRLLMTPAGERK